MVVRLWTLFLVLGSIVWAEAPVSSVAVRPITAVGDSEALAREVQDAWSARWRDAGWSVDPGNPSVRWEARGQFLGEGGPLRLALWVIDTPTRAVVAAEVVAVEGKTPSDAVLAALGALVQRTQGYWQRVQTEPLPVPPVVDSLVLTSPDDGAEVFWLDHRSLGTITGGRLVLPLIAFPSDGTLTLSVEKAGWRTQTVTLALAPGRTTFVLPALGRLRTEEIHLLWEAGQVLGAGAEYRRYLVPDWAFWAVEAYPFVQYRPGVPGSRPVAHLATYGSLGSWVLFPADSWFRWGFEASAGFLQTVTVSSAQPGWYLDGVVVPFGFLVEWNLGPITLENRLQVPYSVGLPTGLLGPQWLMVDDSVPLVSVGWVWKW